MGVGSVLFQLLVVQHELRELLDLNADLIEDLKDNSASEYVVDVNAVRRSM
jgi:hypothetical protein